MHYLKLTCSSPLQYYAKQHYSPLDGWLYTEKHPTKRAITGMLGAALGIERGDPSLGMLNDNITVKYTTFDKATKTTNKNARVTTFMDFQTIRPMPGNTFYNIKGGKITGDAQNSMIKHVEMVTDTVFYVYVGSENRNLLRRIYEALLDPVFPMYFGKRRCIPNRRISEPDFTLLSEEEIGDVHECL